VSPAGRPGIARRFPDWDRRCGRSVVWTAWRIGASLLRRRSRLLAVPVVEIGGARAHADLRTPLGLGLYRYGFYPAEARLLPKLLLPGDLVGDGGANIGLLSLIAARLVGPTGRVLACEPGPGTMALLKANADENRFDTIELHEVALSDRPGRASFTVFEAGSGLASFAPQDAAGSQVEVVVTTLDALTEKLDRRVTLVKLDIEGAEAKALRGARGLIGRDAPARARASRTAGIVDRGCPGRARAAWLRGVRDHAGRTTREADRRLAAARCAGAERGSRSAIAIGAARGLDGGPRSRSGQRLRTRLELEVEA
jgi:FkbM family methyltransferase